MKTLLALPFLFASHYSWAQQGPAPASPDSHYRIQCALVAGFGRPHQTNYPPAWKVEWMKGIESASGGCRNGEFLVAQSEVHRQHMSLRSRVTSWEIADLSQFLFALQQNSLWNWALWLQENPEGRRYPGAAGLADSLQRQIEQSPQYGKVASHKDTVELVCRYRDPSAYAPIEIPVSYSPSDRWVMWGNETDNLYKSMVFSSKIDAGRLQIDLTTNRFSFLTLKERHQLPGVPDKVYSGQCVRKGA